MADTTKPPTHIASADSENGGLPIAQTVVNLHIARRTLLIYPARHEQVKRSLVKGYKSLAAVLRQRETLVLTVMDGGLGVDNRPLKANNPVFKELAHDFKRYGIAAVIFHKGIEIKELARFLQMLTIDSETIADKGGIAALAVKAKFRHLSVQKVDYSRLELTEEDEIQRTSADLADSIWQQFVTHLLDEPNGEADNAPALAPFEPAKLAALLNDQQLEIHSAVDQYSKLFGESLDRTSGGETSGSQPVSQSLVQFQHLIRELNPELQDQFLKATFEQCGPSATMSDTANLIDGLGVDLIVQMLRHASVEGREISPSLLAFVTKMGESPTDNAPPTEKSAAEKLSSQDVNALLSREEYESYVDEGYARLLHALTMQAQSAGDEIQDFSEKLHRDIRGANINAHIGRAIGRMMVHSPDSSSYRNWARQLTYLMDELLDSGAFAYLAELIAFIRKEQSSGDPERSAIAGLVMDKFNDPQFVANAIDTVHRSMDEMTPEALVFLMELGEPVVVEIFDGLDPDLTLFDQGIMSQILGNLSSLTANEALARIKDSRPEYVRRMVRIIRRLGDTQSAERIRPLLDHSDGDVRLEALATLLKFRNKWGLIRLRELMDAPWSAGVEQAFSLAGEYMVRDVVPRLLEIAQGRGDTRHREAALRALGEIGDSSAVPVLARLIRSRWNVFSNRGLRLKQVIFESLSGYPADQVKDLLHLGLQQKDERTRYICENTLKEISLAARSKADKKA